jgi:hypothetical protein
MRRRAPSSGVCRRHSPNRQQTRSCPVLWARAWTLLLASVVAVATPRPGEIRSRRPRWVTRFASSPEGRRTKETRTTCHLVMPARATCRLTLTFRGRGGRARGRDVTRAHRDREGEIVGRLCKENKRMLDASSSEYSIYRYFKQQR